MSKVLKPGEGPIYTRIYDSDRDNFIAECTQLNETPAERLREIIAYYYRDRKLQNFSRTAAEKQIRELQRQGIDEGVTELRKSVNLLSERLSVEVQSLAASIGSTTLTAIPDDADRGESGKRSVRRNSSDASFEQVQHMVDQLADIARRFEQAAATATPIAGKEEAATTTGEYVEMRKDIKLLGRYLYTELDNSNALRTLITRALIRPELIAGGVSPEDADVLIAGSDEAATKLLVTRLDEIRGQFGRPSGIVEQAAATSGKQKKVTREGT